MPNLDDEDRENLVVVMDGEYHQNGGGHKGMSAALAVAEAAFARKGDWPAMLATLRRDGWMVAVHNDYRVSGDSFTFWLFTHPNGRWIKGEGGSDAEAIAAAIRTRDENT